MSQAAPHVSVLLPTFNRLEYMPKAIDSVFAQTFTDWELIIADDGSSGEALAYLRRIAETPRVRLIRFRHTGNPAYLRNAAAAAALGEYVAFLDSDDLWAPVKLERQLASLRAHRSRRWSYTKFVLIDPSGQPTQWMRRTGGWPTPDGWILDRLARVETVISLPSVIVERSLLREVGGFDETLLGSEDIDLWLRLAVESEVDALAEPLTLVHRHDQHFSARCPDVFLYAAMATEKAMRAKGMGHLRPVFQRERARIAVQLARWYAASGDRRRAYHTLISSTRHISRHPPLWSTALTALAVASAPGWIRAVARRIRRWLYAWSDA
jgi:glycosyltransferase involved in cell wall biosynthesis